MTRSEDFAGGFESVRQPQFKSVQQQHAQNFQALSVLDNIQPNQNGMGVRDLQRRMVGVTDSAVGRSDATFDRQLWLRHREPSQRIERLEGKQNGEA